MSTCICVSLFLVGACSTYSIETKMKEEEKNERLLVVNTYCLQTQNANEPSENDCMWSMRYDLVIWRWVAKFQLFWNEWINEMIVLLWRQLFGWKKQQQRAADGVTRYTYIYREWWRWWLRQRRWWCWMNEINTPPHATETRIFVCTIWINDAVQLIVLSTVSNFCFTIARYTLAQDVQMLCMFPRSFGRSVLLHVRANTHTQIHA